MVMDFSSKQLYRQLASIRNPTPRYIPETKLFASVRVKNSDDRTDHPSPLTFRATLIYPAWSQFVRKDRAAMRLRISTSCLLCLVPAVYAGDPSAEKQKLEKAGARVRVDNDLMDGGRLRVSFASLDDKSAAVLRGAMHIGSLTVEDASHFTDRSLAIVGTLTNLQELNLGRPAITSAGMSHLKNLKELRKLYLLQAKVYDSGVLYLKDLEHLEELDLSGSGITSSAASTFKGMPSLKMLAVPKTKFGDAGAAELKELTGLKSLEADISVKAAMALEAAIPGIKVRR
jgi:Leucine-rich repeat (LRR) protein